MNSATRLAGLCLSIFALTVSSFAAGGDSLRVEQTDQGVALLAGDSEPFHVTGSAVSRARLVSVPGGNARIATWTETDANGNSTPFYALGLNGAPLGRGRATSYTLELNHGAFDPLASVTRIEPALAATGDSDLHIVQFVTHPIQDYRDLLESMGADIRHFLANHALIVEMPATIRAAVEKLDFVRWVGPYHPAYRVEAVLRADAATLADRFGTQRYSILLFETGAEHKNALATRLRSIGARVDQEDAGKFLMTATMKPEQLLAVAQWNEIAYIDRWTPLEKDMDLVRAQGGADDLELVAGYRGQGVRGESFDTGFNINHPDFASRPPLEHGGAVGNDSHGTACLGICFGDGSGDPQALGLLPEGQPIAADYNNIGLTGTTRYNHTGELNQSPYFAVFQTASVGSGRTFNYTTISADHDTLLFDWDVLHCQSQSNAGNQDSRPQAWAKNVVSGGAFNHYDTADTTDDCWCSTGSTGPASDGRIKPDLSFYYDSTYTTYTTGSGYGQFGGTSGATPSICGHFGLFYQMWSDGIFGNEVDPVGTVFENRPHMTTAKAFMINTAVQYPFSGTEHDMTRVHQGWGVPNVKNLYDQRNNISFINESVILIDTEKVEFNTFVAAGEPALKVTMTYADPAGNPASSVHRINDLTLKVTSPSGVVYWGNHGLLEGNWSQVGGSPNTVDTVENVFVENPEDGLWVVEIAADEIVQDAHVETPEVDADFALVISGGEINDCVDDGSISMSATAYACEDEVRLRVVDCGLNTDDLTTQTVNVTIESDTEPAGETVVLTEVDPASGTFTGTIPVSSTDAAGTLQVADSDTILATYIDADDGAGGVNVTQTAQAGIDCTSPQFLSIRDENLGLTSATVSWDTNEKATTSLKWGPTTPPQNEEIGLARLFEHSVDLSGLEECTIYYYEVGGADAQGNEGSDDNAGNYYTFETLGDFGDGPVSCHRGNILVTSSTYSCSDVVTVRLSDLDLNVDPLTVQTVTVELTSQTEAAPEFVLLTETGPNTSTFEGTIATALGAPASDGVLQLADGDVLTATYHDRDNGLGSPALSFDTAIADCVGPAITDITVDTITDQRARVRWTTDVPADTLLEWGSTPALGQSISSSSLTTSHSAVITRGNECGELYFRITSTDGFGDTTVADRAGSPFNFSTGTIPGLFYRETFENGSNGWTLGGEWEAGSPQGLGGSSGSPDPSQAYNNDGVLGQDLSGLGASAGDYEPNTIESARSPMLDTSSWQNSKVIYYRNLHSGSGDDAQFWVHVGPQGYTVWRSAEELINDSSFGYHSFDVSQFTGGVPPVQFEFRQQTNGSGHYSGWTIDDFIVKDGALPDYGVCSDCTGVPSFAGATTASDNDACGANGVTVSWDSAAAWGTGSSGTYSVYRGESAGFVPSAANRVASGVSGLSYNDASAPTDRDLWYVVRAESDESCGSGPSGGVEETNDVRVQVTETTDRAVPAEVNGVLVTLLGSAHVRLNWNAESGASTYRIYRSTSPDRADRIQIGETNDLVFDDLDSGANSVSYYYDVIATNACSVEGP